MKQIITLAVALLLSIELWAQSPEKMSYQAIIRNSNQKLLSVQEVGMQISILKDAVNGNVVYTETQSPTTNENGLISIEIGTGETDQDFSVIDWANGIYFIQTEVDPDGGTNYSIIGTSQLLSVPYALYAKNAGNAFSGNYADLNNKPDLGQYLTAELDSSITNELQALSISNDTIFLSDGGFVKLPLGTSFSGSFSDLTNIPSGVSDGDDNTQLTENEVDTYVSNNGYLTIEVDGSITNEIQVISISNDTIFLSGGGFVKLPVGTSFSGSFSDLANIPSGLSDGDDNTHLTEAEVDAFVSNNGYSITDTTLNEAEVDAMVANNGYVTAESDPLYSASVAANITTNDTTRWATSSTFSGEFTDLLNVPAGLADGDDNTQLDETAVDAFVANNGYLTSELDGDPTNELELPTQTGNSGKMLTTNGLSPAWAAVSFSDLTDKPANLDLDNTDDFDGNYNNLTNKPSNVSTFTNDAGYITSEVDGSITNEIELPTQTGNSGKMLTTNGLSPAWAAVSFSDLTDKPANLDLDNTDDFDGNYNNLTNKPSIVSMFTNDAGYITSEVDGSITNEIELPTQTGNSGKVLSTNGTSPSWVTDDVLSEAEVDSYVSNNGYLTTEVDGSITNEIELPTQTGNSGKVLSTNGTSPSWVADDVLSEAEVDSYVSNNGYLTAEVDGSTTNEIELPAQTGNNGKYLTTNGSTVSWATPSGGSSNKAVIKSSNYTIQAGENVIISNAGSTITFTLPTAATAGSGAVLHFYGITNNFNISTSESIYDENGIAQTALSSKYIIILVSDGVNKWYQMK